MNVVKLACSAPMAGVKYQGADDTSISEIVESMKKICCDQDASFFCFILIGQDGSTNVLNLDLLEQAVNGSRRTWRTHFVKSMEPGRRLPALAVKQYVLPQDVMRIIADFAATETVFEGYHLLFLQSINIPRCMDRVLLARLDHVFKNLAEHLPPETYRKKRQALLDQRQEVVELARTCRRVQLSGREVLATYTRSNSSQFFTTHRTVVDFFMPRDLKDFESWWPVQSFFVELEQVPGWKTDFKHEEPQLYNFDKVVITSDASIFNPFRTTATKKRRREEDA
jgi:hypothetical protein